MRLNKIKNCDGILSIEKTEEDIWVLGKLADLHIEFKVMQVYMLWLGAKTKPK